MIIFCLVLVVFILFFYGLYHYLSSIESMTSFDFDQEKADEKLYLQYRGLSFFAVASSPFFNSLLFDKKYMKQDISDQLKEILARGSLGYRVMIFSMLAFSVIFFLTIFWINT